MIDNLVAIVFHVSENDVEEVPGCRMKYREALQHLTYVAENAPSKLPYFDLCAVMPDGTLGRYVSWAI
jgi:hypothetical protein